MSHKLYAMPMAKIYALYIQKITKKSRTIEELNLVIAWLTGYSSKTLESLENMTVQSFFDDAPKMHDNRVLITGKICGIQIETIEEPLMKNIRYLDKLVDELAKGRALHKIIREAPHGL
jgi:hypothetical protein